MLPPASDADQEDPTTQIAWPNSRRRGSDPTDDSREFPTPTPEQASTVPRGKTTVAKKRLSTWDLITLSISMLGAQIVWTVELGYGTPFLLTLGISEQLTALVWLAGPISGLIAQPVIGAVSDSSTSKYRRRYWVVLATVVLIISTLVLAYCEALAAFFVDLFQVGAGDWDEKRSRRVANTAIGFAIVAFYLLDFALNGLQASLRNLLLDITPASQLNAGNAWHGRMTHAGNIIGFGFGFLPLDKFPIFRLLGGTQFRKFCVLCMAILVITVWITCALHEEQERETKKVQSQGFRKLHEIWNNIKAAILNLPKPIRRVCYVQFFAFMGWFPFLFYSTTYVGQIMALELDKEPDPDVATRTGEFAMLLYSIVAVVAGTVLPHLASRDRRLMGHREDVDENAELARIKNTVRQWKAEAARKGKPLRLPMMPFLLRNIWTGALLWFTLLTFSTFFVSTVAQATVFIALVGVSWAVAMWAPFAIIMELLKELSTNSEVHPPRTSVRRLSHSRTYSTPGLRPTQLSERQPLLRRRSYDEYDNNLDESQSQTPVAGGTILGVHNLAIVLPQFVVAVVTSIIFRVADGGSGVESGESTYYGKNGVAWVLRFGGLCTLVGAVIARMVSPTPTEKAMRRRLKHLNNLFPELQFPDELARRILTHSSHPAAVYGHNAALSFMGRRVISAYLSLLLSSSPNLKLSDDVEAIVTEALNTYVLGEHIGSKWGLGRVMRWTPTLKADSAKNANIELLASVGLYKVQGDAVAAVIGGIYEHFGASTAHRVFYTRVLPHILINKPKSGLPEAFHSDARSVCNRFGGMSGPLVVDHSSLPPLPTEARKTQSVAPEPSAVPSLD
ncbi:hypothetical protein D9757_002692 [Collybiopsis confluens]|uniref:RNase III domain-containing protein n=1 Tax=Collybiopsis confluens TaxID=2823264 RepID=A0A8H5MDN0_9AGAR|nr:hypothetical protein D9757_002692 [Collybiopsis confluens]